jgi:Flp pilus assembly protein protease CpaA
MSHNRLRIAGLAITLVIAAAIGIVLSQFAPSPVIRVGLSAVLVGLALYDLRFSRVPNPVVMPLLLAVLPITVTRLVTNELGWGRAAIVLITWLVCFSLWWLHVIGGGDAKLVMALIGTFPDNRLLLAILLSLLVGSTATLLIGRGRADLRRTSAILVTALAGHALPTREEIGEAYQKRSSPATVWISAGGLLYLWWIW